MTLAFFSVVEQGLLGIFGSMSLVGAVLLFVFVVLYLVNRINFRNAMLLSIVAVPSFVASGWMPSWVAGLSWFIVVGFGLYYAYGIFKGY